MSLVNQDDAQPAASEQASFWSMMCTAWNCAMLICTFWQHNTSTALICNVCVMV
ncbi:hypothetical protein [Pectobacterium carotovorum]|uniref:hypothetical protein n=1 Tax=Pectobacterium carotovorum TaxID=554 RepID=UPI0021C45F51|nr:hypothetical protein [Pectobacterium carotovorum]